MKQKNKPNIDNLFIQKNISITQQIFVYIYELRGTNNIAGFHLRNKDGEFVSIASIK